MRRKLKRFAVVVLALGLVGFVGWHSYIGVRLALAERAVKKLGYPVTLDGWLERWQIPPGEPNAADLYWEAFEAMADEGIDYDLLPVFDWNDELAKDELYPAEVLEEMRRYVALNEEALGLLFRAGTTARSNFWTSREDVFVAKKETENSVHPVHPVKKTNAGTLEPYEFSPAQPVD